MVLVGAHVDRLLADWTLAPHVRVVAFVRKAATYVFAPITDQVFANGFD